MEVTEMERKWCRHEHHPVMPRRVTVYYGGRRFVVSTIMVPSVVVTVWQGNQPPHGAVGMQRSRYYRQQWYNVRDFPNLARSGK